MAGNVSFPPGVLNQTVSVPVPGDSLSESNKFFFLNLTNAEWAYNFGNPFSGTHFGPGRTIQIGLRAAFH